MTKIVLGQRPKTFRKTVSVPMLDGSTGSIVCDYRYRTRKEFAELLQKMQQDSQPAPADAEADADATPAEAPAKTLAQIMVEAVDANGDYLMQILAGWNLDVPLTTASAQQLCDELPAAATAVMAQYAEAIQGNRLGN